MLVLFSDVLRSPGRLVARLMLPVSMAAVVGAFGSGVGSAVMRRIRVVERHTPDSWMPSTRLPSDRLTVPIRTSLADRSQVTVRMTGDAFTRFASDGLRHRCTPARRADRTSYRHPAQDRGRCDHCLRSTVRWRCSTDVTVCWTASLPPTADVTACCRAIVPPARSVPGRSMHGLLAEAIFIPIDRTGGPCLHRLATVADHGPAVRTAR